MFLGWWSIYVEPCNTIARLIDSDGILIDEWKWETEKHGDESHRMLLDWSLNNKGSKGMSIGTNDGTTGEWVYPLRNGLIDGILVEASEQAYNLLVDNYKYFKNANTIMTLVTPDGGDIEFFESIDGEGFTNSTSKEHLLNFTNEDNIRSVIKKSISINDLIINNGLKDDIKWLHIDVEGIDDELILSLDFDRIKKPEIIIYETLNLSEERKNKVIEFLHSNGYECKESGWNTIAKINKLNLSLLVHTCDSYEKFWSGMFYTLDFYWDYDKIPVYFANEEKSISDVKFDCKGSDYKPDSRINQILTGRSSDKSGFSTRFIQAISKINTKYVLYMQEDMWLKRSIDINTFEKIIKFMDDNNATSVRLHAKLFYYNSYKIEPTEHIIDGVRMFKNVGDHVLSHNATIWRKDYILKHQRIEEDPWLNEEEGSKRMLEDNDNNYHYNIHWYCQPGIAEKGDFSHEAMVYSHIVDEMMSIKLKY
jgi:hypothetical protein